MQRRIAFCVDRWSSDSTLFSWTFAKQFFLRKQRTDDGLEVLSDLDKLFVVHVGKKEGWDFGGPILPKLSTALENYPHQTVELEGRDTASTLVEFASRNSIDVIIIGSRENKNAAQKMLPGTTVGSISENVKARVRIPCLIVRPSSARNERMRIKSMRNLSELASQSNPGTSLPQPLKASILNAQPTSEPRRVCIAFEHTESGSNMISWAAKHCLFPDDDIRLVHCTNRGALEKMQKSASFQRAMLKPRNSRDHDETQDSVNLDDIGKEDLQRYHSPDRVRLKGDAKTELVDYNLDQHIDLCIVGFSAASRMKKALSGGSLSSHLLQHGSCPILVIPLKAMAWEEVDTVPSIPETRPPPIETPGLVENEAISPSHSLGPRVSISRSLSHQLSQASGEGFFPRRSDRQNPLSNSQLRSSFPPRHQDSRRSSSGELESRTASGQSQPSSNIPSNSSPFQNLANQPRDSMDSADLVAPQAGIRNIGSQNSGHNNEVALLQQQLREKSAHIRILEDELKHLRVQVQHLRGNSPPNRIPTIV